MGTSKTKDGAQASKRTSLSAAFVRKTTKPGRYADNRNNLYLQITAGRGKDGHAVAVKSWLFRYSLNGKSRAMGLGTVDAVSLAEAREAARQAKQQLIAGVDPLAERERQRAEERANAETEIRTFDETVKAFIAAKGQEWRNDKHREQWRNTLKTYASPRFGAKDVAAVDRDDVLAVLSPIWSTKTETASRLRGRIEAVLDYAMQRGWRPEETGNPAVWRGKLDKLLAKPSKVKDRQRPVRHHPALPWREMPALYAELQGGDSISILALRFTIMTVCRSGEVFGAGWPEIDFSERLWRIPGTRMKGGKPHVVPLTDEALIILEAAAMRRSAGDLVFAQRFGRQLSPMAMLQALRKRRPGMTVHGMRSAFKDWCTDATSTPDWVSEMSLAHVSADKVRDAYARSEVLEKRRRLAEAWESFLLASSAGNVVPFAREGQS